VIGGKYNDCVVKQSLFFKNSKNPPDLRINKFY